MNRGDVYWVSLNPTQGHEQTGFRPVVVVSPAAFNIASKVPVVLPISNGGAFAKKLGFSVSLDGHNLPVTGLIRCDQPRVLDLNQRQAKYLTTLPEEIITEMLAKVRTLFA